MKQLLLVTLLLALPGAALAQDLPQLEEPAGSPRDYFFEFNVGKYMPRIDNESGLRSRPYGEIFDNRKMWLFEAEFDVELFQQFGTLSVGFASGFGSIRGKGIVAQTAEPSPDDTSLKLIPLRALVVYRFDWFARELGIPLIPFGKAGPAYTFWWATNGDGEIVRLETTEGTGKARGGKWGYQLSAGLALELNFLDPQVAREFDSDVGVNSTVLTVQAMRLTADNYGGEGFNLSDDALMFGLGFEF